MFHLLNPLKKLQSLSHFKQKRGQNCLMKNPIVALRFLQKRVEFFFERFFLKDFSMIDYWHPFEWQNKESEYVHGFFWLQDGLDVSYIATNNDEKRRIIKYFDRLICSENPDAIISIRFDEHFFARNLLIKDNVDVDDNDYASLLNWVIRHSKCGS